MKLDQVKRGDLVKVVSIPDAGLKEKALRMGIDEGSLITCSEVIPAGPVVVCSNRHELAIGRSLARNIEVELPRGKLNAAQALYCQDCCKKKQKPCQQPDPDVKE